MPFVGDIFDYTSGTAPGPAGTTISSTKAAQRDTDVKNAINTTTSIGRGGTGATTAVQAADNISTVGANIVSETTTDLSTATGKHVTITGTTTITAFGTEQAGAERKLTFAAALTLTHNATSLILPGGANITTAAGDVFEFVSEGSGNWRCVGYALASGKIIPDSLFLTEKATAKADVAGDGQFWVETATPNLGKFTDDEGNDFNLIPGYIKLSDVKPAATEGGTFTSGAWQTRTLNTEDVDTQSNCSLSSNQFTLDAGTYVISCAAPVFAVDRHKAKLRNISDSTDIIIGKSSYAANGNSGAGNAVIVGRFTISSSKTFEIQHRCQTTGGTNGFGVASNFSVSEVYTEVELWKVA